MIGPYRVLHQIGSGVLGPVFRVLDPDADAIVAVKLFKFDWPPEQAHALAGALQTLIETLPPHPSIVAPLAAGLDGSTAWLAEELAAADALDARMRRRTAVGAEALVAVLRQVASAIDVAAQAGWRHGALHPRDILVDTTGRVRVTGVGIAQLVERYGARPARRRPYGAPERSPGQPWDVRADVFALAVIAAEWLAPRRGRPGGEPLADTLGKAGFEGEATVRVLEAATSANPDDRPASLGAFVDALAATIDVARLARTRTPAPGDLFPATDSPELPPGDAALGGAAAAAALAPEVADGAALVEADEAPPAPAFQPEVAEETAPELAMEAGTAAEEGTPELMLRQPESAPVPLALDENQADGHEPWPPAEAPPREREWQPEEGTPAPAVTPWHLEMPEAPPSSAPPHAEFREEPGWPASSTSRWLIALAAVLLAGVAIGFALGRWSVERQPAQSAGERATTSAGETARAELQDEPVQSEPPSGPAAAPQAGRSTPPAAAAAARQPQAAAPPAARSVPAPAPRQAEGRLVVRSAPSGARVRVNGENRGTTPLTLRGLEPGEYRLEISRQGYATATRRARLTARNLSVALDVPLEAERAPAAPPAAGASMEFVTRPAGARVFLDGRQVGVTPLSLADVPPGRKTVRFELPDHAPWTTVITLSAGDSRRVTASLERVR